MSPRAKSQTTVEVGSQDARRRRGSKTKENILRVASQLFDQKGFDRTSMNEIAEGLAITKPSLYYHFKSKEELVFSVVEMACHNLYKELDKAMESNSSPVEKLRKTLRVYGSYMKTESMRHMVMTDERILSGDIDKYVKAEKKKLNVFFSKLITQAVEELGTSLDDVEIKSYAIFGMYNWMAHWNPVGKDIDHILDVFDNMILYGLSGPSRN
jgi:TetR/AcrR family transcriptional regulator, cholesterol catabolism regulator